MKFDSQAYTGKKIMVLVQTKQQAEITKPQEEPSKVKCKTHDIKSENFKPRL